MLSFDITDRHVRIIRGTENHGKIKVADATTIDVEEGLIVNGHIKDIPKMATIINDEIKNKRMADKEAVISISSNLIIFKELHIPKAKGTQLLTIVQNQMQTTMGIADDYSISYTIAGEIEEDGVQAMKVLATACPFEVVDCFRKVFSMLGIALRSVAVSCNTISRIILNNPKNKAKMPMLLVQIDPTFVSLNLYENNQLTFSRFASIDPEDYDNSEDYIYEAVNENVFRMFQFQRSRNGDNPIQNVVFYGETTEYIRLTNALEQMDITTSILGTPNNIGGYENFEFQEYANAIGAMFRTNKDTERINLIEVDAAVGRSSAGASFFLSVAGSAIVSAAIVGAVWIFGNIQVNQYNSEAADIQAWMDSPEVAAQIAAVDAAQTKLDKVNIVKKAVSTAALNYESLPVFTTQVISDIEDNFKGTSVDWTTLSYGNGAVSITCHAKENDEPAEVVGNFVEQDIFDNITYTGFTYQEEEAGEGIASEIGYEFNIDFDIRETDLPEPEPENPETPADEAGTN
ncbi:MAG: pilus assembly protein PilM [Oscillospiraceae bacterium]|nr:pilus assembly protein PilM [Oscillospiraceae bacterium]